MIITPLCLILNSFVARKIYFLYLWNLLRFIWCFLKLIFIYQIPFLSTIFTPTLFFKFFHVNFNLSLFFLHKISLRPCSQFFIAPHLKLSIQHIPASLYHFLLLHQFFVIVFQSCIFVIFLPAAKWSHDQRFYYRVVVLSLFVCFGTFLWTSI